MKQTWVQIYVPKKMKQKKYTQKNETELKNSTFKKN